MGFWDSSVHVTLETTDPQLNPLCPPAVPIACAPLQPQKGHFRPTPVSQPFGRATLCADPAPRPLQIHP